MPPLVVLGLAWTIGMASVALWAAPVWLAGCAIAMLVPAAAARWIPAAPLLLAGAAIAAIAGACRFDTWASSPLPQLANAVGREVVVVGTVDSLPDPGRTTARYAVRAQRVEVDGRSRDTEGGLLVTLDQYTDWERGTVVQLRGELESPPLLGSFDYRGYLARRGIVGTMFYPEARVITTPHGISPGRAIDEWRGSLQRALERALPEPEASLGVGIALGRDGNIPDGLYDDYRRSGLAHVIAVSGSNVALLTAIVFVLLLPIAGRNGAIVPAAAIVAVYVLLAGAEASVIRAGIMAGIFLLGMALGRQQSGIAALAAAGVLMTAWSPGAAVDVGFQLSFAATAGLLFLGPWLTWLLRLAAGPLRQYLPAALFFIPALTLAATIATAPLLWLNFGQLSLVGVLANVLVEPVFALALGLSLLTGLAGVTWEPLGWLVGLAAWYPLAFMNWLAQVLGSPAWASLETGGANGTRVATMYAGLGALGWLALRRSPPDEWPEASRRSRAMPRLAGSAAAGGLVVAVMWFSLRPLGGPGALEVTFLDVGQGDATLVTTPGGHRILVDGGPSGIELARELGAALPHWERTIDYMLLTHPQQDHLGGLPELARRFDVEEAADTGNVNDTRTYALYDDYLPRRERLAAGDGWEVDGVRFDVLWPPHGYATTELNDTSLVLSVRYGDVTILLTGDIQQAGQQQLLASNADVAATIIKVPHHGSKTSEPQFFDRAGARLAVISVGADNRFGHPAGETLTALADSEVYRTDRDGRIRVRTDGTSVEVATER